MTTITTNPVYAVDAISFSNVAGLPPVELCMLYRQLPDALLVYIEPGGVARARCAVWWSHTPDYQHADVGLVGHYYANDSEAACAVLETALHVLAQHGCTVAIGPMDGSMWETHRFVIGGSNEPPFLLEPSHPASFVAHFTRMGFDILTTYTSARVPDLATAVPTRFARRTARQARLTADEGITVRHLTAAEVEDPYRMHALWRQVFRLSLDAFADNLLYTPITETAFFLIYGELLNRVALVPELLWVAEQHRDLVGVVFAFPDWSPAQHAAAENAAAGTVDSVVVHTLAVSRAHTGMGLGGLLVDCAQAQALAMGYRRAIHVLMPDGSRACDIDAANKQPLRQYALFARSLATEVCTWQ